MENNIHNIDVNVICDFFIRNRRQGPGSNEVTKCAFQFLPKYGRNALFLTYGSKRVLKRLKNHKTLRYRSKRVPIVWLFN